MPPERRTVLWSIVGINIFFFFFNEIECKKEHTKKMQSLWISKDPRITEEKGRMIKRKGGGVRISAFGF